MASSDLLSQDEIDALLSGVDGGDVDVEPEEPTDPEAVHGYDFSSQDRIVRGHMPTLELINERFARNLRIGMFDVLRRSPAISVEGIQVLKFGEYVQTLLMPSRRHVGAQFVSDQAGQGGGAQAQRSASKQLASGER